ncbi:hypothetical protein FUAX_11870 [Fulvitalea axinellae]|uniref:Uncharacterized protein n=2 Tax=Fulvitalea axinellae TaxID=1182444 RepID=A0AAU9DD14_9BACT|nr:hypothetical protein FUAX_11870 [Fulvitalea axinellae]
MWTVGICLSLLLSCANREKKKATNGPKTMEKYRKPGVIESLEFHMTPGEEDGFILADKKTWLPFLQTYPAFIRKEYWKDCKKQGVVRIVIYWESLSGWKSVTDVEQQKVYDNFHKLFPKENYELRSSTQYKYVGGYGETIK